MITTGLLVVAILLLLADSLGASPQRLSLSSLGLACLTGALLAYLLML